MAQHRSPGGQRPDLEPPDGARPRGRGAHRLPAPPSALRGRAVVAAVAAGAFVAAGQSMHLHQQHERSGADVTPLANSQQAAASFSAVAGEDDVTGSGGSQKPPEILPVSKTSDATPEVAKLTRSEHVNSERIAAEREANRPKYVSPADGRFTSGFGGRWGTTHYGIDIANSKNTPIRSAADGRVIEAGPASGFGLWVRVQHDDGTITVYGHVHRIVAKQGQRVQAGDEIATMGERGFATGPHLHFEVWNASTKKINPLPWLREHGITIPGAPSS